MSVGKFCCSSMPESLQLPERMVNLRMRRPRKEEGRGGGKTGKEG